MNWIHKIFTTPEAVISFINTSNIIFIIVIIVVGKWFTYNKYSRVIEEIKAYDFVISYFTYPDTPATQDSSQCEKWEEFRKELKSYNNELRPILFLPALNAVFAKFIALELKRANSYFDGLSSLGLFGTVFGLLIGAIYTTADNNGLSVMISSFSTALLTTFFGLLAQIIIRVTGKDVEAENMAEEFQGKMLQLEKLAIEKPEILSDDCLVKLDKKFVEIQSNHDQAKQSKLNDKGKK